MLKKFSYEAKRTKHGQDYLLWKEGYYAKQIETNGFVNEKLDYIHSNPVDAGFLICPKDYVYSSARNYVGELGVLEVEMLD